MVAKSGEIGQVHIIGSEFEFEEYRFFERGLGPQESPLWFCTSWPSDLRMLWGSPRSVQGLLYRLLNMDSKGKNIDRRQKCNKDLLYVPNDISTTSVSRVMKS